MHVFRFENNHRKFHGGVDLYAEPQTECYAIYNGKVEWVSDFKKMGWGKSILTQVNFKDWTCWALYAHLSDTFVKKGTPLNPGTLIGRTGITGNGDSRYPHLHFEIWKNVKAGHAKTYDKHRLDPLYVLGALPFQPFSETVIKQNELFNRTA